jgi:hypothetical protein
MQRPTFHVLVLLVLWLLPACRTIQNPDYCAGNTDCDDGWTCDMDMNRCVPPPGAGCGSDAECLLDVEPICDLDAEMPTCRACFSSEECRAKNGTTPFCNTNTGRCTQEVPPECTTSANCMSATAPICDTVADECKPCNDAGGDAACEARNGDAAPFCVAQGDGVGSCAQCLDSAACTADAPVCDPTARTCGACKEHSDCAAFSGVCGDGGACAAESDVLYVVKSGTSVDMCTRAMPCGTVNAALALVSGTRRYLLLDDQIYAEHLDLEDIAVTIIGENATILGTESRPVVSIANDVDLELEGLIVRSALASTTAAGILCSSSVNSSTILLRNVNVRDNGGVGIGITRCSFRLERSMIANNTGGGIDISNADFSIVNSFILANGKDTGTAPLSTLGGVRIINADVYEPQFFAFNTVAANRAGTSAAAGGVQCSVNASSTVVATSSIIRKGLGGKPTLAGDCVWNNSNVEDGAGLSALAPMENGNHYDDCGLADDGGGIYRVTTGSPCDNAAQADTGVDVDYEGESRPATPGMPPDMGADELN